MSDITDRGQSPFPTHFVGISDYRGRMISVESIGETNALIVHDEDVDDEMVNFLAHEETATTTTLASAASVNDTSITLASAVGFAIGDRLEITEGTAIEFTLPFIINLVGAVVTLDGPLDNDYTTDATVTKVNVDMNVLGSLAAPVTYVIKPHSTAIWHITRLNFHIRHTLAADDSKFGGIAALTNGVVIRVITALNGTRSITNWKINKDMIEDMYDVTYHAKAGAGDNGTNGRWSFKQRTQAVLRLDGSMGDQISVLIQDDLTTLIDFQMKFQGHVDEA